MRTVQGSRAPLWLFLPLLVMSCFGLLAAAIMATIALGIGVGASGNAPWIMFVVAPIATLAMIVGGTVALWRGRVLLGSGAYLPPILLGFGLLWLSIRW